VATDDPTHADLLAIHSRLGVIEGKVNLVARAERAEFLELQKKTVTEQPLVAQIYLLVDGNRSQAEILSTLEEFEIPASQPTVSRRMNEMENEHGMITLARGGSSKVYAKDREMEKLLNLTKNVRQWLAANGETVPEKQVKRPRKRRK
jgi:DNA-binding transcriptional ArsR family regulator